MDYQYYIESEKRVPKDSKLNNNIIVKSGEAAKTSSSLINGKRIYICGTTENSKVFFAIYNTVYNLTEYVYDADADDTDKEVCKDIHVDESTGHFLIITEITDPSSITSTILIKIRGFSLESKSIIKFRNGYRLD